jgi:PAS domain S-box-containing protein
MDKIGLGNGTDTRRERADGPRPDDELLRLGKAVESSSDAIGVADADGRSIYQNPAFVALFGYTASELNALGGPRALYVDPAAADAAFGALAEGRSWSGEADLRSRDGRVVPTFMRADRIVDASGNLVGVVSIATDIRERRRAEAFRAGQTNVLRLLATGGSLEEVLEALVRTVEDQAPGMRCSVLLLDADGKRLRHGVAPSLPADYCQAIDGLVIGPAVGSCGSAAHSGERVVVVDTASDPRWADFRLLALRHGLRACWSEPVVSADGKVLGTLAMYYGEPRTPTPTEIDLIVAGAQLAAVAIDRKRAEDDVARARDRAVEAARLKSEFLANMSHEIRTPMNGVIGMTDLALETELTTEQREYLDVVRSSADALLQIIDDILDFSKIEAGRLTLEAVPFALREVLDDVLRPLALRAVQKGLYLGCEVSPEVPDTLVGDPGRLRQVIVNLVGNALKFTEAGQVAIRVGVESRAAGSVVVHVEVTDTGIGVPPDKQQAIFGAFVQADGSTTRRFGGTGLGLAISAQLVEMMEGQIWVESTMGEGSTFHFTARLAANGEEPAATRAGPADALVPSRSVRVLLAEDNAVNRLVAVRLLEKYGHTVVEAVDGRQALAALEHESFDVVLMDVQMPVMDGFAATAAIRDREQGTGLRLPIVALTAHAMQGDRERCLEAGMDAYVTKPIKPVELLGAIAELVPGVSAAAAAVEEPRASGLEVLDAEQALGQVGGDMAVLAELIAVFRSDTPRTLAAIREGLGNADPSAVARAAHRLKGSLVTLGAHAASAEALRMEALGRAGDLADAEQVLSALEHQLATLEPALSSLAASAAHEPA